MKRILLSELNIWVLHVNRCIQALRPVLLGVQSFNEGPDSWEDLESLIMQNDIRAGADNCCRRGLRSRKAIFNFQLDLFGFGFRSCVEHILKLLNYLSFHLVGNDPGFSWLVIENQILNCFVAGC